MPIIAKVPHEVEQVFGPAATDKFIDFLNSSYLLQKEDVVTVVSDRFEKSLIQMSGALRLEMAEIRTEMADVRTEMAEVRTEMAELRSDMRTEMAELRSEVRTEIAGLRSEFAGVRAETKTDIAELRAEVKSDIASVHREIALQTRWILAAAAGIITLYPLVSRLIVKLIP